MTKVDARGDQCPIPVVKTKKAMKDMSPSDILTVLVDNETAMKNVSKMAENSGAGVQAEKISGDEYKLTITIGEHPAEGECEACSEVPAVKDNTVVVIASDRMGEGNDELGKVLIKGFIFAVTQLETLPKTILFYNGGATLTSEGSDSLEDLKNLEEQGVEILTCGTCLNYYGMSDKLQVGSVTNMYTIVEKMAGASKIIRP